MTKQVEISVKRINRFDGEGTAKAFCDLTIGDSFLIKGIKSWLRARTGCL